VFTVLSSETPFSQVPTDEITIRVDSVFWDGRRRDQGRNDLRCNGGITVITGQSEKPAPFCRIWWATVLHSNWASTTRKNHHIASGGRDFRLTDVHGTCYKGKY